ncbi:peptidoglycan/LPS O-acetylase OafA/YrhL [Nakamurella sp. UYEF19]|uniref:acyltransferase family protein n=1 Tax=Nakamurella sp. UYEF19 TaxID=1756392 RepID=UPI003394DF74
MDLTSGGEPTREAAGNSAATRTVTAEPQPAELAGRRFRPDIQGLRCIAVVLVVLYHCGVPGVTGGYVGVDVFFVISGFLITGHLLSERLTTGRLSLSAFYARRIRRLLPSALVVIAVTVVAARLWGPPLQSTSVAKDGIFSTFYLMNYRLAAAGVDYQHIDGSPSPLQHFWSLAVEEQFYIFWPLLIIGVSLVFRRRTRLAIGTLAVAGTAASLVVSVVVTRIDAPLAYFAIQTRAWELGVGAILAIGTPALLRLPGRIAVPAGWVGLVLLVSPAFVFTDATPFPGAAAALPVGGAALVLAAGPRRHPDGVERILQGRVVQYVGRVSYGLYLWHWPLIVLAPALLGDGLGWGGKLAAAVVGLALATASNVLIEQRVARTRFSRPRAFILGGAMSVVVTVAAVTIVLLPRGELSNSGPDGRLALAGTDLSGLSQLLTEAYTAPHLPSNLVPSLTAAVDDVPPTTNNGCNADFLVTTEPPCVFGDPSGTRTVVLYGDSHAEQWFGALNTLAIAQGWKLVSWTKAACPLADVLLTNAQLQRPFTECPAWRSDTIAKISALHPDLVIASGSDSLPGPAYSNAEWSAQTVTTLARLQAAAPTVVYLADIPTPATNVPVCLAAHVKAPATCQFPARSATPTVTVTDQLAGRHAAVIAAVVSLGVPVIDPTPWLCAAAGCPVVVRDTLLYRDATHLTQAYSKALAPILGRALDTVVRWMKS